MTAFLQRYVLENEFLRVSRNTAVKAISSFKGQLRDIEEKLANSETRNPAQGALNKNEVTINIQKSMWASNLAQRGGNAIAPTGFRVAVGAPTMVGSASSPTPTEKIRGRSSDSTTVTQAEVAFRRLKRRVKRSFSAEKFNDGEGRLIKGRRGDRRSGPKTGGGGLISMQGRIAELCSLLAATESERDSLAALLVLVERRMERMAVTQEELALKLAWQSTPSWQEQIHKHQPSQGSAGSALIGATLGAEVKIATCETANTNPHATAGASGSASTSVDSVVEVVAAPPRCTAAIENIDLRRRVHDLEVLNRSMEADAREIARENKHLKAHWSWLPSWGGGRTEAAEPWWNDVSLDRRIRAGTGSEGDRDVYADPQTGGGDDLACASVPENDTKRGQTGSIPLLSSPPTEKDDTDEVLADNTGSFAEVRPPSGWDPEPRPMGRRRPRSSPLGLEGGRQLHWDLRQRLQRATPGGESTALMKGQLAWVLGLPAGKTTEHELLAEVMRLVVERGSAITDAEVLETQLAEMDAQSLSVTQLAAEATATTATVAARDDRDRWPGGSGGIAYGAGVEISKNSLVSSLSYGSGGGSTHPAAQTHGVRGGGGGGGGARRELNTRSLSGTTKSHRSGQLERPEAALNSAQTTVGGVTAPTHGDSSTSVDTGDPTVSNGGSKARTPTDSTALGCRTLRDSSAASPSRTAEKRSDEKEKVTSTTTHPTEAGSSSAEMGAVAGAATAGSGGSVEGGDPSRASFPRMLQGRVVSIDIFCVKVKYVAIVCKHEWRDTVEFRRSRRKGRSLGVFGLRRPTDVKTKRVRPALLLTVFECWKIKAIIVIALTETADLSKHLSF